MKIRITFVLLLAILIASCSDDTNPYLERVLGQWKYVKSHDGMRYFRWINGHREAIEFTSDSKLIGYDSSGLAYGKSNIKINRSEITSYGKNVTGSKWEITSPYFFLQDTLVIRADGGFEHTDNYFVRMD